MHSRNKKKVKDRKISEIQTYVLVDNKTKC